MHAQWLKLWIGCGGNRRGAISPVLWDHIAKFVVRGMRTLETGSGLSTWLFGECGCHHTALEHDPLWHDRVATRKHPNVNLCLAPLVGNPLWYDWRPTHPFDLILVDGPQGKIGRQGILNTLAECVHPQTIIILDDVQRRAESRLALQIADQLKKDVQIDTDGRRSFAILK